jgi:predicted acylesterase/phospholipase RssA
MDASRGMRSNGSFSKLTLDGGGARGIYSARLLARIEQSLGAKIKHCFDLIAGTSTGSILAAAATSEIPMASIVELFENEAPSIFWKRRFINGLSALWQSRYSRRALESVLQRYVPVLTLGEISVPLMITSADLATGGVHLFKSAYLGDWASLTRETAMSSYRTPSWPPVPRLHSSTPSRSDPISWWMAVSGPTTRPSSLSPRHSPSLTRGSKT